jgi:branched-subunit amino acid aminotransferase/4-amino-4-deoxychorismate lyase
MSTNAACCHWFWEPELQEFIPLENKQSDFPTALLWGYSVFTSFRYPLPDEWLNAHLERLFQHAHTIGANTIGYQQHSQNELLEAIKLFFSSGTFKKLPSPCSVRLTLYPDVHTFQSLTQRQNLKKASWTILLSTFPPPPLFIEDVRLVLHRYQRPLSDIKHVNYLPELLLLQKSQFQTEQAIDILRVNPDNSTLEEASTSNLFLIQQDETSGPLKLITPSQNSLKGILQQEVIDWAASQGLAVTTESVTVENLRQATGVFLSNSGSLLKSVSHWMHSDRSDSHPVAWSSEAQQLYQGIKRDLIAKTEEN